MIADFIDCLAISDPIADARGSLSAAFGLAAALAGLAALLSLLLPGRSRAG